MGISGFIPMNSIRDFDREHIADPVLDFLTSKDIDPNLRLSYFEYLIQSAFVSNPNFAHIENNIAAAINKPLKRLGFHRIRSRRVRGDRRQVAQCEIDMPFWIALEKPKFETARDFMKKAITQRDNGGPDPAVPASKALEAVLRQVAIRSGVPSENSSRRQS